MASSRFLMAFITFMATIVAFYIFYVTFGPAFDQMGITFAATLPSYNLPTAWFNLAVTVLGYWKFVYSSVTIILIAMIVWVVRVAIIDQSFERPY